MLFNVDITKVQNYINTAFCIVLIRLKYSMINKFNISKSFYFLTISFHLNLYASTDFLLALFISSCWKLSFTKWKTSLHWVLFIHTTWIIVWLNKTFVKRTRKNKMGISMQIFKFVGDKESKKSYRISSYVISKADCFLEWAKYIMWCFWLDFRHSIMNEYSILYSSKSFKRKWNC